MKKIIYLLFFVLSSFILTGCTNLETDEAKCDKIVDQFVDSLNSKNTESLKELFSLYVTTNDSTLDKEISNLFSYYEGTEDLLTKYGNTKSTSQNDFKKKISFDCSLDLKTEVDTYRIALSIYTRYDEDDSRIGLESVYILKASEDPYKDYVYHGDGLWTIGCNIGKIWENGNEK